ncbi:DUF397 domain-containing protein [Actinophytocola sp.]|uniref:DUF397 domain-containing protein n=1 Tax=Actinophytocola sp. TaxID=1872138 RepID=UPI002D807122|nr:DUF397 domain-containing protein [Actinophytocola sp.]HET9139379.1 DUF397 domain-containing protein [Actinophytocola sp.]
MTPDLSPAVWRKSSRSAGNGGNCVEVAQLGAIRDSKNPSPVLLVGLDAFLAEIKAGRFDRA